MDVTAERNSQRDCAGQFIALDMVEEGDRVAVRWQLSATYQGEPLHLASMAIYRFMAGRIAEAWGIPLRGKWPEW